MSAAAPSEAAEEPTKERDLHPEEVGPEGQQRPRRGDKVTAGLNDREAEHRAVPRSDMPSHLGARAEPVAGMRRELI